MSSPLGYVDVVASLWSKSQQLKESKQIMVRWRLRFRIHRYSHYIPAKAGFSTTIAGFFTRQRSHDHLWIVSIATVVGYGSDTTLVSNIMDLNFLLWCTVFWGDFDLFLRIATVVSDWFRIHGLDAARQKPKNWLKGTWRTLQKILAFGRSTSGFPKCIGINSLEVLGWQNHPAVVFQAPPELRCRAGQKCCGGNVARQLRPA